MTLQKTKYKSAYERVLIRVLVRVCCVNEPDQTEIDSDQDSSDFFTDGISKSDIHFFERRFSAKNKCECTGNGKDAAKCSGHISSVGA
jgi:hypothetical protein